MNLNRKLYIQNAKVMISVTGLPEISLSLFISCILGTQIP